MKDQSISSISGNISYNVRRLPTCVREEAGEQRDPAPECRHVPSGLSIKCRVVLIPAGKARSAAAAIVQLYELIQRDTAKALPLQSRVYFTANLHPR